jgi:hypothetical protein
MIWSATGGGQFGRTSETESFSPHLVEVWIIEMVFYSTVQIERSQEMRECVLNTDPLIISAFGDTKTKKREQSNMRRGEIG